MKKLIVLFLFLICGIPLCSAVCTATGSGLVTDAIWDCGHEPTIGDQAKIPNGMTVTNPYPHVFKVGTTPPDDDMATPALSCTSAAGTGVFINYGTLDFQGSVQQCNANWIMEPGSTILHDSSLAGTPSAVHYTWQIGMAANQANAILYLTGTAWTAGNYVTVDNAPGSGRFGGFMQGSTRANRNHANSPTGGLAGAGRLQANFTYFNHLGVSGTDWLTASATANHTLSFTDSRVTDSSTILLTSSSTATTHLSFVRTSITAPVENISIQFYNSNTLTTGEITFTDSAIEGGVVHAYGYPVNISHTLFAGTTGEQPIASYGGTAYKAGTISNTLLWNRNSVTKATDAPIEGLITSLTSIRGNSTDCDHLRTAAADLSNNLTINGMLAESYCSVSAGTAVISQSNNATNVGTNFTVENLIGIPLSSSGNPPTNMLMTDEGVATNTNLHFKLQHNTFPVSTGQGFFDFEGVMVVGAVGRVSEITNNLLWRTSSGACVGCIVADAAQATQVDNTITLADYNSNFNVTGSLPSTLYALASSKYASTPGSHDFTANPQFVNNAANMLTWAATIDASVNTYPLVLAKLLTYQTATWDSRWDWNNYYAYAQANWAPKNIALKNGSSDGNTVGAVGYKAPVSGGSFLLLGVENLQKPLGK